MICYDDLELIAILIFSVPFQQHFMTSNKIILNQEKSYTKSYK